MNKEKSFSREEFLETWTNYIDDTVLFEMLDWIESKIEAEKKKAVIEVLNILAKDISNICPLEKPSAFEAGHLSASKIILKKLNQLKNEN